jgi:thiazole tautomerase (transcriptional regulator TenI)
LTDIPRFHLLSNREICPVEQFPQLALAAVCGGVGAVHLREPGLTYHQLEPLFDATQRALEPTGALLIVNVGAEAALKLSADGIHVPERLQNEIGRIRAGLRPNTLIGSSVHSLDAARNAERLGADYVIAGHVFETGSKPGSEGRGLDFIERVSRYVSIPVIAIGGITPERVKSVLGAGAHGVAVMSGILAADDPGGAASRIREAIEERCE